MKELLQENGLLGVSLILVARFAWDIYLEKTKSKDKALDANTLAIQKLNKDLNRYYFGLKYLAGDDWPKIKKFIEEEPQREI